MKRINNTRDGYHYNSSYWQNYKRSLPKIPKRLREIAFGMILGDATVAYVSRNAYIKFEQGSKQKEFIFHLFELFKSYCFMQQPQIRYKEKTSQEIKSYWFKTFSFPCFTEFHTLFYKSSKYQKNYVRKTISKHLVHHYLTPRALAYWIMCDGSLQNDKKSLILHTQSYNKREHQYLSNELNRKFQLHSRILVHKEKYYVIYIPSQDSGRVSKLISKYMIPSFNYKIPMRNMEKNVNDIV